jgi:DNA-binding response OmpR family regulator
MTSSSTLKLLAIDDDARGLEVIELALRRQGLDIMTSQDPDEGFEMFLRTRPKIVLLDLVGLSYWSAS